MKLSPLLLPLVLGVAACNQNTAIGNDREAQIDPAPSPGPVMNAAAALNNVTTAIIKPETMSQADVPGPGRGVPGAAWSS